MVKKVSQSPPPPTLSSKAKPGRAQQKAQALRDNLLRRKATAANKKIAKKPKA